MNIHGVIARYVGAINPVQALIVQLNAGTAITNADGSRVPIYFQIQAWGQVQPFAYQDIVQSEQLNIQGIRGTVRLNGRIEGLVRTSSQGGDLIGTPDGRWWKVALVTEAWPDWTAAIVTLEVTPSTPSAFVIPIGEQLAAMLDGPPSSATIEQMIAAYIGSLPTSPPTPSGPWNNSGQIVIS